MLDIKSLSAELPVLIAGPTASGKSELALQIAQVQGGIILNADASQVFDGWRIVTARPSPDDEARAPHALYGHVGFESAYSAGDWLREVTPYLRKGPRVIIVGGTGLYLTMLTHGIADIPPIPAKVRAQADALRTSGQLQEMIDALDAATRDQLDLKNPMRVQRAWEVQRATGRGLQDWQAETPPPLLALDAAQPILLDANREWLNARITRRFDAMVAAGALEEARANLHRFDPTLLSCKAIGAPELVAHLRGEIGLDEAKEKASIATRQFAKRQRTWFRSKMRDWRKIALPA